MDIVTQNLVNSFKQEQGFPENIPDSTLFEHFVNYCVVSKEYSEEFQVEDICVAGSNDLQLDGVAIIVNGVLINTIEEIDDLANTNRYIDAEFIFIQAKASKNFDGADISNMFFGIQELFNPLSKAPRNDFLAEKESLIKHIYDKSPLFRHGNPQLKIYYTTTGKWQEDDNLKARINREGSLLEELNIFRTFPIFEPVDAKRLQQFFSQAKNSFSKTIMFSKRVTLPAMKEVKESYLGYLPVSIYLDLITDENGKLLRGLFYDNVRDFQGDNPVNKEIEQTLVSEEKEAFILLNNGVTVVADDLSVTGDNFKLTSFQIVNGCQTSHILFNNQKIISDSVHIPIKLIVSSENVLKNRITKATNRQTAVKLEELSALTDFQKNLEQYYNAIEGEHRLYYERRSQQYRSLSGSESSPDEKMKIQIIPVSTQIRAFASMFLNRAPQASRYYNNLLNDLENQIFVNGHCPIAYYVSAYALFRIESALRKKQLNNRYKAFKYHLLGILRMEIAGTAFPIMTSNKFEKYCATIRDELWDEKKRTLALERACKVLDKALKNGYDRDRAKDSTLQDRAKKIIQAKQSKSKN
ncbi:AIPR family protein [Microcoleus sp. B7-D4]|uniref:AIPR family protein n=1 Tax=Microcoleus sp. B7-D4 TaxID=2818696 RepID=UPI002FCF5DFF